MLRERKINVRYKHIECYFCKPKVLIFNLINMLPKLFIHIIAYELFRIHIYSQEITNELVATTSINMGAGYSYSQG